MRTPAIVLLAWTLWSAHELVARESLSIGGPVETQARCQEYAATRLRVRASTTRPPNGWTRAIAGDTITDTAPDGKTQERVTFRCHPEGASPDKGQR